MAGTGTLFYSILPSDLLVRVIAQLYILFSRLDLAATPKIRPSAFAGLPLT
jgi:hypothetical protein